MESIRAKKTYATSLFQYLQPLVEITIVIKSTGSALDFPQHNSYQWESFFFLFRLVVGLECERLVDAAVDSSNCFA